MKKLTRRQVVLGLGAAGAGALAPSLLSKTQEVAAISPSPYPSCTLTPEQTEGPFYFETNLIRRDITEGRPGTILDLKLKIVDSASCEPIPDAVVDIWSCDAAGEYSGYESVTLGSPPAGDGQQPPPAGRGRGPGLRMKPATKNTFMRGAQVTDAAGEVQFKTIYPGWYQGRATHIHIKVYLDNNDVLTSQMYFPEEINDTVYKAGAYTEHKGKRLKNEGDGIFKRAGKGPMTEITQVSEGYVGTMTLGVNRG